MCLDRGAPALSRRKNNYKYFLMDSGNSDSSAEIVKKYFAENASESPSILSNKDAKQPKSPPQIFKIPSTYTSVMS